MSNNLLNRDNRQETMKYVGSSQTIREKIRKLSIHKPKKYKYSSNSEFGYYLAGLMDGDGHIDTQCNIVIVFSILDISLAYYLKSRVGFGSVRKVKDKEACIYIVSNKEGRLKIGNLICGKLCTRSKVFQYNDRLRSKYTELKFQTVSSINFNSSWFSGFVDADGSFRIHILERKSKVEVRLLLQIDQKSDDLLIQVKNKFGGYLGYRSKLNTYYYSSVSLMSMYKLLKYFDTYPLQSYSKYLKYFYIRKSYIKQYDKSVGWKDDISRYKYRMSNLRDSRVIDES